MRANVASDLAGYDVAGVRLSVPADGEGGLANPSGVKRQELKNQDLAARTT